MQDAVHQFFNSPLRSHHQTARPRTAYDTLSDHIMQIYPKNRWAFWAPLAAASAKRPNDMPAAQLASSLKNGDAGEMD